LFDPPPQRNLSDVFPLNEPFWLLRAEFEGVQPTTYGDAPQAAITVCPVGNTGEAEIFRVWGTLARQVEQMDPDDLPAQVVVRREGRRHMFGLERELEVAEVGVLPATGGDEDVPF
jgi:hypothetical protein